MRHINFSSNTLPEIFLERLSDIVGPEYDTVLSSFSTHHPTTFRVNSLKAKPKDVKVSLVEQGFTLLNVPWLTNAFILVNRSLRELSTTNEYINGLIYVQSLSSMIPALILGPKPNMRVLDICAAPGSKTTQMAAQMQNTGEILANDKGHVRLYKLEANLKTQGVTNTKVRYGLAETLWKDYPEYFDATLVDVPCSMEGRFQSDDPKTYEDWSVKKVKLLADHQKWILRSAISATKPGGVIVYSTCTLSPEENEGVIDWILKKEKGSVELEEIDIPGLESSPGLIKWKERSYDSSLSNAIRIYPSETMEGFFVAKLKKIKSNVPGRK